MIQIKEINQKKLWERFEKGYGAHSFLHSWEWGEFQEEMGNNFWRLGIFDGDELKGIALIVKSSAKRGTFLLCPHGPLMDWSDENHLDTLIDYLRQLAKSEKASCVRISPVALISRGLKEVFIKKGFRPAPLHAQSEINWILNIEPTEDNLLAAMRKTTRYSIKKAAGEGIVVRTGVSKDEAEKFNDIYQATVSRQHFVPYSLRYLRTEFEVFSRGGKALILSAKYGQEILASAMIIFSGDEGYYHHGASNQKYPKIPASYFLLWQCVLESKKRGCRFFNFWGISPEGDSRHPWAGLTLFKKGFGGFAEQYMPAHDLAVSPKYWLTFVFEKIRKVKRGF